MRLRPRRFTRSSGATDAGRVAPGQREPAQGANDEADKRQQGEIDDQLHVGHTTPRRGAVRRKLGLERVDYAATPGPTCCGGPSGPASGSETLPVATSVLRSPR